MMQTQMKFVNYDTNAQEDLLGVKGRMNESRKPIQDNVALKGFTGKNLKHEMNVEQVSRLQTPSVDERTVREGTVDRNIKGHNG